MRGMNVDVVALPQLLSPRHLAGRTVVVFDVIRATTSMAAALAAGVSAIHVFADLAGARAAKASHPDAALTCGEERCLPPADFDLGNSPSAFRADAHAGRTLMMSTTNGTRAIIAARGAKRVMIGALVNAAAVGAHAAQAGDDVTLLCAGTHGEISLEDLLGAGAVLEAIRARADVSLESDSAHVAHDLFERHRADLGTALRSSRGGHNVIAAGLEPDLDFAARLNLLAAVGVVHEDPLRVVRVV